MPKMQRVPSFTTIRLWVLKFGLHKLNQARERASDWAAVVDHTIQIGFVKVFIVLGLRLSDLPPNRALAFADVEPLVVLPMPRSTGQDIEAILIDLDCKLGSLRQLVGDDGSHIKAGVKRFRQTHPECDYVTDIVHKLARLLHKVLNNDPGWRELSTKSSEARTRLLQTAAAHLIPPQKRDKARYLNLEELIRWARRILTALEGNQLQPRDRELIFYEFGWVRELKADIDYFHELWQITSVTRDFVRTYGVQRDSADRLTEILFNLTLSTRSSQFAGAVIDFLLEQSAKARPGERLIGSSEIIESVIGSLKYHLGTQSRSGFTSSILIAPALVGKIDEELVLQAMMATRVGHVLDWADRHIGQTIQAKRREFYRITALGNADAGIAGNGTENGNIITVENHPETG